MPQQSIDVATATVDAVNRRDTDAFVACLSPDVEWEENGDVPGARVIYREALEAVGLTPPAP
jgi:ketosteroid isomerase-like protein